MYSWEGKIWAQTAKTWTYGSSGRRGLWHREKSNAKAGGSKTRIQKTRSVLLIQHAFSQETRLKTGTPLWRTKCCSRLHIKSKRCRARLLGNATGEATRTPSSKRQQATRHRLREERWRQPMETKRHFSLIFSILKFHLTLEAVLLTNINETHFAAAGTFIWTQSKNRDTNLCMVPSHCWVNTCLSLKWVINGHLTINWYLKYLAACPLGKINLKKKICQRSV